MVDKQQGIRATRYASLALAFASLGDAFLYPFLPVNSGQVGITVSWVGLLLSVNRFVRILFNRAIVVLFARVGPPTMILAASILAIASTTAYAYASGAAMWLLLRILWGISFAALRLGTVAYALQQGNVGASLGLARSAQEFGPMFALMAAPWLMGSFSTSIIFLSLGLCSLPALYFASALPRIELDNMPSYSFRIPSRFNAMTLITAILIDGLLVVVLGNLFLKSRHGITTVEATALAAFYLALRRAFAILLAPVGGMLADRVGFHTMFNITLLVVLAGLVLVAAGCVGSGTLIVFASYSINTAITPGAFAAQPTALVKVAEHVTWKDVGAAIGTLLAGFFISSSYLYSVIVGGTAVLAVLFLLHVGTDVRLRKTLNQWK